MKIVVYNYESMNRELKTRPIYECRYDERLKTKDEGTPKDRDDVNRRDVCGCDG